MSNFSFPQKIAHAIAQLPGTAAYTAQRCFSVKAKFHQKSLIELLNTTFPHLGATYWRSKIDRQLLLHNGQPLQAHDLLQAGWQLTHLSPNYVEPVINTDLQLIFEDDTLLVINKPAPLPVHACGRYIRHHLSEILHLAFPNQTFRPVHRLDAATTGLLVFAKDSTVAKHLAKQFTEQTIEKRYLAEVRGIFPAANLDLNQSLTREVTAGGGRLAADDGAQSLTRCQLIQQTPEIALLELAPKTGRTNQIRLHLASMAYPIIGDTAYENPETLGEKPFTDETHPLHLHAAALKLQHPKTGINLELTAPAPNYFSEAAQHYAPKF